MRSHGIASFGAFREIIALIWSLKEFVLGARSVSC